MKSYLRLSILALVAGVTLVFSGCASVPMASSDKDTQSKEFKPRADRASIYIYRNENFGAAIPMAVSVNKRAIGQTAAKTYFHLNVLPGRYTVESVTENVSTLNLNVDAGKNYFVWQEVKMGMWAARSALQQVDDTKGRAGVMESKEIASTISEDEITPTGTPVAAQPAPASPTSNFSKELENLDTLRKESRITEEEYQKMRANLVEKYQK